ncbi:hypothetical protein ACA910_006642 [Epithemia clementina (nom. ined.)]
MIPGIPGGLQALPGFAAGGVTSTQQDKINRELFVGNTPPGTSELLLTHFLNAAMRRVGLCQPHETPILNCRLNPKFAFVELVSAEMANQAMNMNGIPFLGAVLKVSRPSKYTGPNLPNVKSWQQLTGASLPAGAALDAESEKMSRELFIGNTTPEMSEGMIRDFLGNAMEQVGLTIMPGNPIQACRVSGKFAFVELRSAQEATNALNLNNIPFMGAALRVGRPSKWNGPPDQHGNWEDILAKYMAGELQLPSNSSSNNTAATVSNPGVGTAIKEEVPSAFSSSPGRPPSCVVELQHMLTMDDLMNEEEYQEILEDTREECSQFGKLVNVVIPKADQVGATKVFLEYESVQDAAAAVAGLEGRTFDGRRVLAQYFDVQKYQQMDYS